MNTEKRKTPILKLVGEDGNAFSILGRWTRAARKAGWNKEDIDAVMKEAQSADYNHLLSTIMDNSTEEDSEYED